METVFINLCIHPIDFSDKKLTMCSFLLLYFDCPVSQVFIDSSIVDVLFDRWHYSLIILDFFFVHIQTLPFFEHLEINFFLEPAYWDLRNCTICNFYLTFWFEFPGGIWSLFLQDFGTMCNWGIRTLHLWLQMKWEEPVCQSGPIARVRMKVWV